MLRGDLSATSLAELLTELSDARATGCVYLQPTGSAAISLRSGDARGEADGDALVALREGAVSNVVIPGNEDAVAARLIVTGRLSPSALDEAREAQESELPGWAIPDLLIHLGLADEHLVCTLLLEQALADLSVLCAWREGTWRFRRRERWGPSLPTPLPVAELLAAVEARHAEWSELVPVIGGADTVVSLSVRPEDPLADGGDIALDPEGYAMLCAVDGVRTIAQLGDAVGQTLLDAGRAVAALVEAGLAQVARSSEADDQHLASAPESGTEAGAERSEPSRRGLDAIAAAFAAPVEESELGQVAAPWQQPRTRSGDSLAEALSRVSLALTDSMQGTSTGDVTPPADEPEPEPDPEPEPEPEPEPAAGPEIALVELSALVDAEPLVPAPAVQERADASRLLTQLAEAPVRPAAAPKEVPNTAPTTAPSSAPVDPTEEPAAPAGYVAAPRSDAQLTDTAALMRELSSLGTEQTANHPPTISRPSHAGSGTGAHARKRKGLFGRS